MHPSPSGFDLKNYRFAAGRLTPEERRGLMADRDRSPYGILAHYAWEAAAFHYHFGPPRDARSFLKHALADADEYYFGDWRLTRPVYFAPESEVPQPYPDEHTAREDTWDPSDFKEFLAAALALGDRPMSAKLAGYLLAERMRSEGADVGIGWTDDAIDVYEAQADLILGRPPRVKRATPARKKLPHKRIGLMRDCLFAATDGDAAQCLAALKAFVNYFRTREIEKGEAFSSWLSTDATIAYHLMARRLGRPLELSRDDLYHVMVLKEE